MVVQSHLCVSVIIWPTLRVASRQLVVETSRESSPIVNRSVGEYPKPISSVNGVAVVMEIDGEEGGSLESNRRCFLF